MLDKADQILKLALALAALCVGIGVGYYYGIHLPALQSAAASEKKEAAELALRQAERKAASEQAKEIEKESKRSRANIDYSQCLIAVQEDYVSRWQSSCATLNREDRKRREVCLQQYSAEYCNSITVTPEKDCSLPNSVATDYDEGLERNKKRCLEELKLVTG